MLGVVFLKTSKNINLKTSKMKKITFITALIVVTALTGILFSACETKTTEVREEKSNLKITESEQGIFEIMEPKISEKKNVNKMMKSASIPEFICGTIQIPKILKELNRNDIYASNIKLEVNASLQAYGFTGSVGKKDVLLLAYLTRYKDYTCGNTTKRVQVGLKLYVHASDLKVKVASPSLAVIAAVTELGLAKAEYWFETFGISPDNFYANLPSAQFTVDTYSKVISAYDNIIHSLKDSTEIDPIITDVPILKN